MATALLARRCVRLRPLCSRPISIVPLHRQLPQSAQNALLLAARNNPRRVSAVVAAAGGATVLARLLLAPNTETRCISTAGEQHGELVRSVAAISEQEGRVHTMTRILWRCIQLLFLLTPVLATLPLLRTRLRAGWLRMLVRALEKCGPVGIKWGQWASTRYDIFEDDLCDALGAAEPTTTSNGSSSPMLSMRSNVFLLMTLAFASAAWAARSQTQQGSSFDTTRREDAVADLPAVDPERVSLAELLTDHIPNTDPLYGEMPIQPGMHILRRLPGGPREFKYEVFRHATNQTKKYQGTIPSGRIEISFRAISVADYRKAVHSRIGIVDHPAVKQGLKQHWQLYGADGEQLTGKSLDELARMPIVIAFEGGKWVFPVVRLGFKRPIDVEHPSGQPVVLETLSLKPVVLSVTPFLTDAEIETIIATASPFMKDSPVALMDHDQGKDANEWRTSTQHWLSGREPTIDIIQDRAEALLKVPRSHQEGSVQVLRYQHTQKYDSHNDYFDMAHYKNQPAMVKAYDNGHKNRLLTLFWYMSNVSEGGETQFPRAGNRRFTGDYKQCQGLQVKPIKGTAVLFYSMLPSGTLDPFSLHGGCPVLSKNHTKWAANQWVWNKQF